MRRSTGVGTAVSESRTLAFNKFWTTYDNWKEGILNYFGERYTSAAVEGIAELRKVAAGLKAVFLAFCT